MTAGKGAVQGGASVMEQYLAAFMDLGELLLENGAEVGRVEDTIQRLCAAFGFRRADVFSITSSIVVTAVCQDGGILTQTRRVRQGDMDLDRVAMANDLSRRLCASGPAGFAPEEISADVRAIRIRPRIPWPLELAMYLMISAAFSAFFGGSWGDIASAALCGAVLYAGRSLSGNGVMTPLIRKFFLSAVTGTAAVVLVRSGLGTDAGRVVIGNIMLVIPGVQLTASMRDMISGDVITGFLNMGDAALGAIAVAAGFALPLSLL